MKRALNVPDSIGDEGVQERVKIGLARKSGPTRFMIVHKDSDLDFVAPKVHELVQWLGGYKSHDGRSPQQIIVCPDVLRDTLRSETDIVKFVGHENMVTDEVDLIITMGGDGTVLLAAWLFQEKAPPIVPFHFGTLGFLTLFHWDNFAERLGKILREGSRFNTRMRLNCRVHRTRDGVVSEHNVLNEIVVERGASPFMCVLDLFGDGIYLTTVQADGAAVATPTGSTAYSLSAGGSVVHPDVTAMLVTPICPHSLSFRPLIVPGDLELKVVVSASNRGTVWVSFDGRSRLELDVNDYLVVKTSAHPVYTLCRENQTADWFHSLSKCLHWNER